MDVQPTFNDEIVAMSESPRFQFSLKSLLIVVTLSAVFFAALRTIGVSPGLALLGVAMIFALMALVVIVMRGSVIRAVADDPMSLQRIASFRNDFDAAVAVAALADAGIRATAVGGYTSGFRAEAPGDVYVVVMQRDATRAREVLAEIRAEEEGTHQDEEDAAGQ